MLVGQTHIPRIDLAKHLSQEQQRLPVATRVQPPMHSELSEAEKKKHRKQLAYLLISRCLTRLVGVASKHEFQRKRDALQRIERESQRKNYRRRMVCKTVVQSLKFAIEAIANVVNPRRKQALAAAFATIQRNGRQAMQPTPLVEKRMPEVSNLPDRWRNDSKPTKQWELQRDNQQLRRLRQTNKQEIQNFSSEMNQLLLRHEHSLRRS